MLDAKPEDIRGWDQGVREVAKRYLRFVVFNEYFTDDRRNELRYGRSRDWQEMGDLTPYLALGTLTPPQRRRPRGQLHEPYFGSRLFPLPAGGRGV